MLDEIVTKFNFHLKGENDKRMNAHSLKAF
jgi:hypothetical protein